MGGFVPIKKEVNIFNTAQDITALYSDQILQKKIVINNEIEESMVHVTDPEIINVVLRNLVINAVKFTENGKEIKIGSEKNNGRLLLFVKDQGTGISEEQMQNLFSINKSTLGTAQEMGTGLGLSLCYNLVQKIGGSMEVESEPGKGSIFLVSIP